MVEAGAQRWPITTDLSGLRARVERHARHAGLAGTRLLDLVLAVNEAAANVLEHAGGVGTVAIWHDRDSVVVDITDARGRLTPLPTSPSRPDGDARRGFGLWLMAQLCDHFAIHQGEGRSRVRLQMSLRAGAPAGDEASAEPRGR